MNNTFDYINLDYLDLMSDGDKEMKMTMLEMLLEELPEEMDMMKSLHAARNWDELCKVSHKMKSTLAFVGNEAMSSANKQIEFFTKNGTDLDRIDGLIATLEKHLPPVVEELKKAAGQL
jgi:HPt (histidine-containing phosphotransfer) domain-containing protein